MTDLVRAGRGAWPSDGRGGTLSADGSGPGRYFVLAASTGTRVGAAANTVDSYAVHRAVYGIQRLLAKARYTDNGAPLPVNGIFGPELSAAVKQYQSKVGLVADGVFGPATAQRFFLPTVKAAYAQHGVDWTLGYGFVTTESSWDPAAVGYIDSHDLGLCQINGPAHPELSDDERLDPEAALMWQADYVQYLIASLGGNIRDGVAAYNLGLGGARSWVKAGRPALWCPPSDSSGRLRDVKGYVDGIIGAAAKAGLA